LAIDLIMGSNIQKIVCKIKEFPWAFTQVLFLRNVHDKKAKEMCVYCFNS
jgi:hypothetical protein